jgi:hypothetical protein
MSAAEDLILTITARRLRASSPPRHDYPVRGRGGQGVRAMDLAMRGGPLVAAFPVETGDQVMLATSTGQSIRCPVEGISFRSRAAAGCGCSTLNARRGGRLGRPHRRATNAPVRDPCDPTAIAGGCAMNLYHCMIDLTRRRRRCPSPARSRIGWAFSSGAARSARGGSCGAS